jgi:virginiamycin B lyase
MGMILAALCGALVHFPVQAQDPTGSVALTGQVSSQDEGPMEGVLVSAKGAGANMTITVVSDSTGRYNFPRTRLKPGKYSISTRAGGYDVAAPGAATTNRKASQGRDIHTGPMVAVEVLPNKTAQLELKLVKAADPGSQLNTAEWIIDSPGTEEQKGAAEDCADCHSLERVVRSKYNAAAFVPVIKRMGTYAEGSGPSHPVKRLEDTPQEAENPQSIEELARFLSTINLSSVSDWKYPLWNLPRPRGKATKVIYTEYDLPRPDAQPRDVAPDSDGMIWYSDSGSLYLGKLDPRTGRVKEWRIPEVKPKATPAGSASIAFDPEGNVWVGSLYQGAIYRFDQKTEKFSSWSAPKEYNNSQVRTALIAPQHSGVDGKVWFANSPGNETLHRLDLKSGQVETFQPYGEHKEGHSIDCIASDPMNNLVFCDGEGGNIGEIAATTGKVDLYRTPSPDSGPMQGNLDAQGRLWFGEDQVNRIGMFDTKTKKFLEWRMVTPWTAPEDAMVDKNGDVWTGGHVTDRVIRLTPSPVLQFTTATGARVEYLLPRPTQIHRVYVDSSTTPVAFWAGSNLGASIVRLEPLE